MGSLRDSYIQELVKKADPVLDDLGESISHFIDAPDIDAAIKIYNYNLSPGGVLNGGSIDDVAKEDLKDIRALVRSKFGR